MKRLVLVVMTTGWLLLGAAASAAPQITWLAGSGAGSALLPCTDDAHWLLSEAEGVKRAVILVGGSTYEMQHVDDETLSALTDGPILLGDVVIVTYWGGDGSPTLTLTDCVRPSPSPTTSPSPPKDPPPTDPPPASGDKGPVNSGVPDGSTSRQGDAFGPSRLTSSGPSQGRRDRTASETRAEKRPDRGHRGPSPSQEPERSAAPAGTVPPLLDGDRGGTISGFRDPRTAPVALVIGVLIAVAVICAFGTRQYFARARRRTA